MTSHSHRHAAARCWERAGFYQEAADRFTQAAAWRDAGRCLSQAERHLDAALAYSRAGEPLLEAREQLMAGRPERALTLYQRLRPSQFLRLQEEVELLVNLGELEEAKRVALGSGDRQAVALFARLTSTRARPDLATGLGLAESGWESLLQWNRSLCRQLPPKVDEPTNAWPTTTFSAAALVPIWQEQTGDSWWGDRALAWSADSQFFAAALDTKGLARGRIGPEGIRLERWRLPNRTRCTRFLPASHAVLAGLWGGEVSLVEENGDVVPVASLHQPDCGWSITFAPDGDRVAVAAGYPSPGALLKVSSWQAGQAGAQLEELREPEGDCFPLTAWSPDGRHLCWSPGPFEQPNRLGFLGQPAFEAHADRITSLAFTADGRFLITASVDRTVDVRDGETGQSLATPERFDAWVYGATVHPQAALVAVGEEDRLHLLRLDPGEPPRISRLSEQKMNKGVESLAFSPDGRHLLVMTEGHLHLFRVDLEP